MVDPALQIEKQGAGQITQGAVKGFEAKHTKYSVCGGTHCLSWDMEKESFCPRVSGPPFRLDMVVGKRKAIQTQIAPQTLQCSIRKRPKRSNKTSLFAGENSAGAAASKDSRQPLCRDRNLGLVF
jgi:hypothetical protein